MTSISRRAILRILPAALSWPLAARGQDRPHFSTRADLVVLYVTVREKKGGYVTGLPQGAFEVFEDDHRQAIRLFTSEDAPVTVGLLVDGSGSMQTNRAGVIAAAMAFAEASHPDDEMTALVFDDTVHAALSLATPFTSETSVLRAGLVDAIHARGRTALYDGISTGLRYVERGRYERKVLVLVSDGGDNASSATFEEVLTAAEASRTVIYTVALVDPMEPDANPKLLRRLAEASGGTAFTPRGVGQVVGALRDIARGIRSTYTLGYVPSLAASAGERRKLNVTVEVPGRASLVVTARRAYLAGAASRKGRP